VSLKRTPQGWQVVSESNKPLSKPDLTRKEAEARLEEVERMKRVSKWFDKKPKADRESGD